MSHSVLPDVSGTINEYEPTRCCALNGIPAFFTDVKPQEGLTYLVGTVNEYTSIR